MLQIVNRNNEKLYVNVQHIVWIAHSLSNDTVIYLSDKAEIHTREPIEELKVRINNVLKRGGI